MPNVLTLFSTQIRSFFPYAVYLFTAIFGVVKQFFLFPPLFSRSRPLLLRILTAHANSHATSCIERARAEY